MITECPKNDNQKPKEDYPKLTVWCPKAPKMINDNQKENNQQLWIGQI